MGCWIAGGAGFFLFSVLPGGAVELPGSIAAGTWRRRPSLGWGSMSSSLSRFSGWRSRSLSLGEGLTDLTGPRDGTRADGVLDRGAAPAFFFFSVLPGGAVELPGRSRPAPGGVDLRWGGAQCRALLPPFSGWRSRSLSRGEGLTDLSGPRDVTRADGGLDRGRRRLFSF